MCYICYDKNACKTNVTYHAHCLRQWCKPFLPTGFSNKMLIHSICQSLWCKYSYSIQFQATIVMSLSPELERDAWMGCWGLVFASSRVSQRLAILFFLHLLPLDVDATITSVTNILQVA